MENDAGVKSKNFCCSHTHGLTGWVFYFLLTLRLQCKRRCDGSTRTTEINWRMLFPSDLRLVDGRRGILLMRCLVCSTWTTSCCRVSWSAMALIKVLFILIPANLSSNNDQAVSDPFHLVGPRMPTNSTFSRRSYGVKALLLHIALAPRVQFAFFLCWLLVQGRKDAQGESRGKGPLANMRLFASYNIPASNSPAFGMWLYTGTRELGRRRETILRQEFVLSFGCGPFCPLLVARSVRNHYCGLPLIAGLIKRRRMLILRGRP